MNQELQEVCDKWKQLSEDMHAYQASLDKTQHNWRNYTMFSEVLASWLAGAEALADKTPMEKAVRIFCC